MNLKFKKTIQRLYLDKNFAGAVPEITITHPV